MLDKLALLEEFYGAADTSCLKIEIKRQKYSYLQHLQQIAHVDYLTYERNLYKYRLSRLSPAVYRDFLLRHIRQELNACLYFAPERNQLFAFNLDSDRMHRQELKIYALYLRQCLIEYGLPPLVIASGHGYHLWGRFTEPIHNHCLRRFMDHVSDRALTCLRQNGLTGETLLCTRHPRIHPWDLSLRLFGSLHLRTGRFSQVVTRIGTEDQVLNEADSWDYFAKYVQQYAFSSRSLPVFSPESHA